MKSIDILPFVGRDFDLEAYICQEWHVEKYIDDGTLYRPRLNKPQVLNDYRPLLVDGLAWEGLFHEIDIDNNSIMQQFQIKATSKHIAYMLEREDDDVSFIEVVWLKCIGVEFGYDGEQLGMPVVEV